MPRVCLRFCVFLLTLSLPVPVYQNAHANSVCEKVYSGRCLFYFQCSTVDIYKYKGKYLLRRIPHASHGSFNPFVISNEQAHIINGNIPVAFRCITFSLTLQFFSHASVLLSQKRAPNDIKGNQYFSLLMF